MSEKKYIEYKVYPFLYSIIPSVVIFDPLLAPSSINRNYLTIQPGQILESPVNFQQDKNHFINYYKFLAFGVQGNPVLDAPITDAYSSYIEGDVQDYTPSIPAPWVSYGLQNPGTINFLDYLNVQIIIDSRGSTIIQDLLNQSTQQTKNSGMGMIRKPFFVPAVSTVSLKIQNTFNIPINLSGFISTYKSTV